MKRPKLVSCLTSGVSILLLLISSVILCIPPASPSLLTLPTAVAQSIDTVTFYGAQFDEDAFVFCLDRSGSMSWSNDIAELRVQTAYAFSQLTIDHRFSAIAFSTTSSVWSPILRSGHYQNLVVATEWLESQNAGGWTCLEDSLLESLGILGQATSGQKAILVVIDSIPICNGVDQQESVLKNVTAANTDGVAIHVIYISGDSEGISFCQQLAAQNGGRFILALDVDPPPPYVPPGPPRLFLRGDADGNGIVNGLADGLFLLSYQFIPGSPEPPCIDAADVNDDGSPSVWVEDAIFLLGYQFLNGHPSPPAPGPVTCGIDETEDELICFHLPLCP